MDMTDLNNNRNVEDIRRKNIEDNQAFLEQLRMSDIQSDFKKSARSIHQNNESNQIKKKFGRQYEKVERSTRYSEKVKAGKIPPHIPAWEREHQKKLLAEKQERKRLKRNKEIRDKQRQWSSICRDSADPYQRTFKSRNTKTSERAEQEI